MDHQNWLELAEIYAARALDGEELTRFQEHLDEGCAECRARMRETERILTVIPASLDPTEPPPRVKERLWERIEPVAPGLVFIHADEGEWIEAEPGIFAKFLHLDKSRGRVTALVRLMPGARYAAHRHPDSEEVLVLEGSCYCGGRLLRQGDYHRAESGSAHVDMRTDEGSLMLITAPLQNDMLPT